MFHIMKKKEILKSLAIVQDISEKFPMLKVGDINLFEMAKFYKVSVKDLKTVVVLLDAMKEANQQSNHSYYIDMEQVDRIKVKRQGEEWGFHIYRVTNEKIVISHKYQL